MIWLSLRHSGTVLSACETWRDLFALGFSVGRVSVHFGDLTHVGTRDDGHDSDLRLAIARGLIDPCSEQGRACGWEALA